MSFLDEVQEKENKFLIEINRLKKQPLPIYIYGSAQGAHQVADRLEREGVSYAGFVVDDAYWTPESHAKKWADIINEEKINLIVAFKGFSLDKIDAYKDQINEVIDRDCWGGNYQVDSSYITYEWLLENDHRLQNVYSSLADEMSRTTLIAYINQKISMDYKYLRATKSRNQYFEEGIVQLSNHDVFVDCGAYTGDSAMAFIEALERKGLERYEEIISFEPDKANYEQLCRRALKHHTCMMKGVSSEEKVVHYSEAGTSSHMTELSEPDSQFETQLTTIDRTLQGKRVTLIKMDIEGFELAALQGAENTIRTWKPQLAICIYHKKEDLWEIMEYAKQVVPEYKFYIRNYEDTATELVLYAVVH